MNVSTEAPAQGPARWLVLIHQIPPKPDYFRVKVRRRLHKLGAVALKNSVYVLHSGEEELEDFQWLARAIEADGGEAMVCEATFIEGVSDEEIEAMFRTQQGADATPSDAPAAATLRGRTWVTREGAKVDRIASAWLIRRFIDPEARFTFVPARGYRPAPGELRFDMYQAEYTHEGERCTFETLLERFALRDRALRTIAEIVHDIDCKDDRYGRGETDGVARLIQGIVLSNPDDAARLERGSQLWDDLYATFRQRV